MRCSPMLSTWGQSGTGTKGAVQAFHVVENKTASGGSTVDLLFEVLQLWLREGQGRVRGAKQGAVG